MKRFLFPLVLLVALALTGAKDGPRDEFPEPRRGAGTHLMKGDRDEFPGRRQGGGSRGSALILVAA